MTFSASTLVTATTSSEGGEHNADMFRAEVDRFAGDFRVVAYDNRGQGRSASAPLAELDMDTLAEDAAALIEALDRPS